MAPVKVVFWATLIVLSGSWVLADTPVPEPFNYFSFRTVFVQYTGIIGIGMMSVAMIIATRPKRLETSLNGLDKMYRLHKWLGIGGLVFSVLHWWFALGTKWMVGWGWLSRPERRRGGGQTLSEFEQWMRGQRELAESLGEWTFYVAVVLIALALVKWFPYHLFRKTHKLLAVAYLLLAYHSVVLAKFDYWSQPVGWILAVLLVAGSVSAALVLAGKVGRSRKVQGTLSAVTWYPGVHVIEGSIDVDKRWPGHVPGQFAFVTSRHHEGAHPYTIASAWNPEAPGLTFIVKALGDWTGQLQTWLKEGMPVTVEGPYGCFDFRDSQPRQIWIGAGIGITPFIAKMKHLSRNPEPQQIDLFHTTTDYDQKAIDKLTADAAAAGVKLHLTVSPKDGRLTPEQIRAAVPEWQSASIWFCGPVNFGESVRRDFVRHGLAAERFHQEMFEMR